MPAAQQIHIPARNARSFRVNQGALIHVIDVAGQQVADFVAVRADDPSAVPEFASTAHTRAKVHRLRLTIGDTLYSSLRRPMLTIVRDDVGIHDLLYAACDPVRYADYGVQGYHANCRDNLCSALAEFGLSNHVPDPFNIFMHTEVHGAEQRLTVENPVSKAGDRIVLRAEMNLIIAVSACSMDLNACNGGRTTDLMVEVEG